MFRAMLACLLLVLPVSGFAVPIPDEATVTASGGGALLDQSASGSSDFDDSVASTARNLVIAYRPGFADSEFSRTSVHYGEPTPIRQPPRFIDGTLSYLGAGLLVFAAGLILIWYLSRYGRAPSKRRRHRSSRIRHAQ